MNSGPMEEEIDSNELKSKQRPYLKARVRGNKKGRIVIRNLSFQATDEKLAKFFKDFGEIQEVSILRLDNGRPKGVAFVQFKNTLSALKAIRDCNMMPFMGRPVAVDLAVPKEKYKLSFGEEKIKTEEEDATTKPSIKTEKDDEDEEHGGWGNSNEKLVQSDSMFSPKKVSTQKRPLNDSDEDDDDDDDNADDAVSTDLTKESKRTFVHNPVSKDVLEGKTLFLRNVSMEASEEQIKELLSTYGELRHVLFCREKNTKRFKGTAFAQYLDKKSADACLEAYSDPLNKSKFMVCGRSLFIIPAVGRGEVQMKKTPQKKEPEDKRNLFLAREGVIRGGTQGAKGVSKSDLALRTERELAKRKMLANLSVFVSPIRLFICNIPLHVTDAELRNIVRKYSSKEAVITECRIMRNLYELDDNGKAVSKGHAFVAFTQHKHALQALRNMNNNPDIFTRYQRPIVEFSLENKNAIKAKVNRLQKSKDKNIIHRIPDLGKENIEDSATREKAPFMGASYDPKKKGAKALHSRIGPKIRHRDHKGQKKKGNKITRNKVNNQLRNSRGMKRKREAQKKNKNKKGKGSNAKSKRDGIKTGDSTKKSKSKKKKFL